MSTNSENLLKISPLYSEIFSWIHQFLLCRPKSSKMNPAIAGVTGPKFTKFLHEVEASLALLTCTLM